MRITVNKTDSLSFYIIGNIKTDDLLPSNINTPRILNPGLFFPHKIQENISESPQTHNSSQTI